MFGVLIIVVILGVLLFVMVVFFVVVVLMCWGIECFLCKCNVEDEGVVMLIGCFVYYVVLIIGFVIVLYMSGLNFSVFFVVGVVFVVVIGFVM